MRRAEPPGNHGQGRLPRMWTAWLVAPAWADCTFDAPPERLAAALDAAEQAYVSLDVPEFERAMTEVDFVVPCLEAPVDPTTAARLHRMRGLGRFAAGDRQGAEQSLRAARALEPQYEFPEAVLPKGFELRDLYEGIPAGAPATQRLPRAARGAITWFDGMATRERPVSVPALWQLVDGQDVKQTVYLEPTEPLPWYPGANKDQVPWLVGAGVTAAAAGGVYAAAASLALPVKEPGAGQVFTTDEQVLARQTTTNALVVTSVALGTAAVGELVVGLLKGGRE